MTSYLDGYEKNKCGYCKKSRTKDGHDGCIGELRGVKNACCGHGDHESAYVQFDHDDYNSDPNKLTISGIEAIDYIACFSNPDGDK